MSGEACYPPRLWRVWWLESLMVGELDCLLLSQEETTKCGEKGWAGKTRVGSKERAVGICT